MSYQERPYQTQATNSIIAEWGHGRSTILVCATGGGKTKIALDALAQDMGVGDRALWLVHRGYLIDQPIEAINNFYPSLQPATAVQAERNGLNGRFVGATVQTLNNDKRLMQLVRAGKFTHLVIDEQHNSWFHPNYLRSDVVSKLKRLMPNMKVLGLTATPVKANGVDTTWLFDSVAAEITIQQLVDEGYLAEPIGKEYTLPVSVRNLRPRNGDYTDSSLGRVMDARNVAEIAYAKWAEEANGRSTIGFTPTITMAENMARYFRSKGVRAFAISGETKSKNEKLITKAFKSGQIQVVFNAAKWIEGFDAPIASCCINLRPTQSQGLFTQMVGRVLRKWEGKENALVLNFSPRDGQSLLTVKAIYDPKKRGQYRRSKVSSRLTAASDPQKPYADENPVSTSVEVKPEDVNSALSQLFIQYTIRTGRLPGQTNLKKEPFQPIQPEIEKRGFGNRIGKLFGFGS